MYLWFLRKKEGLYNPFEGIFPSGTKTEAQVLATGPSLSGFLQDYDVDCSKYSDSDFFVVNDFVHDPHFKVIKPAYYVVTDPMFFMDTIFKQRGMGVMRAIAEKVDWPMIFITQHWYKDSDYLAILNTNKNIRIRLLHSERYTGAERWRFWTYNKGWGNGEFGTVVLNAVYSALVIGYKKINMHGIDHNFFDNLYMGEDNRLCYKETHYFGSDQKLKPLYKWWAGVTTEGLPTFTMREFLEDKLNIFSGHELMARYARSLGAEIVNRTPGSMVDAYRRLKR